MRDAHLAFDQAYIRSHKPLGLAQDRPFVRVVDLFAGCGGLSLGAREACTALGRRFEAALALELEADSLAVYEENFRPRHSLRADIRRIVNGRLGSRRTGAERQMLRKLGPVDVLLAGPPCQGHSNLNNHTRRRDRRNGLYGRVARFAELVRPEHVLIENVPSLVHDYDRVYHRALEWLSRAGYQVDAGVVDVSELGVPQRRKRHVVLASLRSSPSVRAILSVHRVPQTRSASWAIHDLETKVGMSILDAPSLHSSDNKKRMEYLLKHDLYDLPDHLRPPCHRGGGHSYKSMYGRMYASEPSQTITGGFGSPGQGRFIHPNQPRTITPHEAARLQFFPDWFDFSAACSRGALSRMIGNAVPMKLSYVFGLELLA